MSLHTRVITQKDSVFFLHPFWRHLLVVITAHRVYFSTCLKWKEKKNNPKTQQYVTHQSSDPPLTGLCSWQRFSRQKPSCHVCLLISVYIWFKGYSVCPFCWRFAVCAPVCVYPCAAGWRRSRAIYIRLHLFGGVCTQICGCHCGCQVE